MDPRERPSAAQVEKLLEQAWKNSWRLEALDEWRTVVERRLQRLEELTEQMSRSDEIARAVAERLNDNRKVTFSLWQKLGGLIVGGLLTYGSLKGLWS